MIATEKYNKTIWKLCTTTLIHTIQQVHTDATANDAITGLEKCKFKGNIQNIIEKLPKGLKDTGAGKRITLQSNKCFE